MGGLKRPFEAMNEDGWNASARPIPVDALAALLIDIHAWAGHCDQV